MSLSLNGRVIYKFKKPWKDGSSAIVLEPLAFIERLAALIPRPRHPLLTYHGVLAPAAKLRSLVAPMQLEADAACVPNESKPAQERKPRQKTTKYYRWHELIKRVFLHDVMLCPECEGERRIISFIIDPIVIRKILVHLGLPTEAPQRAGARASSAWHVRRVRDLDSARREWGWKTADKNEQGLFLLVSCLTVRRVGLL